MWYNEIKLSTPEGGHLKMVIQSKKVWLADQFVPAAIEVNDGRITAILPYGTKDVDDD